jgi:hypothetical protein
LEKKRKKRKKIMGKGRRLEEGDGRNWKWRKGEEQKVESRP